MSPTLLHADEETDTGAYWDYLRAQTDADLLDIAGHLDPERYPARCDAAGRELHRRRLWHARVYTARESAVRYAALLALALALLTLELTFWLTPTEAVGPSWPTGEMLPEGTPMSEVMRLFGIAILRGVVVWSAHCGLFALLLLWLGGWVMTQAYPVCRRQARADVWRLALLSFAALIFALVMAAADPRSAVPVLFQASPDAPVWQRALPLADPFASYEA